MLWYSNGTDNYDVFAARMLHDLVTLTVVTHSVSRGQLLRNTFHAFLELRQPQTDRVGNNDSG